MFVATCDGCGQRVLFNHEKGFRPHYVDDTKKQVCESSGLMPLDPGGGDLGCYQATTSAGLPTLGKRH